MRRIPELDSLRALAALAVVWLHAGTLCSTLRVPFVMKWGWTAVDLFFVISGYLITTIVLRSMDSPAFFRNFYARRSLRIWPIYYLALFGFVAANLALGSPYPMAGLPYYLTYTQNIQGYWSAAVPPFCKAFAHAWTLAVEEQFYLIWPVAVCLVGRKRLVPMAVAVMAIALAARGWYRLDEQLLLSRCDGLALGGLLAALLLDPERVRERSKALRTGFGLTALACLVFLAYMNALPWKSLHNGAATDSATAVALKNLSLFACNGLYTSLVGLIVCHAGSPALAVLREGNLCYLGRISYGLYLYHNLIFALAQRIGRREEPPAWLMLIAIAATLATAMASWKWIEQPLLARKGRFGYGKSAPALVTAKAGPLGESGPAFS